MIDHLTFDGKCVYAHLSEISLKTTKAFTHGGIMIDVNARTVSFKDQSQLLLPEGLVLADGMTVAFKLVAPDGTLRKQTRAGTLKSNEKQPGILRIAGHSKTPARFSSADGWKIEVFKYRAYFSHPGLKTDAGIPEWLQKSIERQKAMWNRLAWLCRDARRKCSPISTVEVAEFISGTIIPAIDEFNNALGKGRAKEKMKYATRFNAEMPGLDVLWNFVGELRKRIKNNKTVPDGLLEKVIAFAVQFKPDYTPLNDFLASLDSVAEREAKALGLRRFELRPTIQSFKSTLKRRTAGHSAWSDGWPLIKYADSPQAADWGLYYYFNKAGVKSELLESGPGVPGLTFSGPRKPADTGHPLLKAPKRSSRALREAEISIPAENHGRWVYKFGVLQHRPLPPDSHLKQWSLIYSNGALWLCLMVERQQPMPAQGMCAAGLDIGWRRTEEGVRFGTLYEPESKTIRELVINLQKSPGDHKARTPFCIDMGPTRWDKRNITRLLPGWKEGDVIPNTIEVRRALWKRHSSYKDAAKSLLLQHLGDRLPVWFDKTGISGLRKLQQDFKDDPSVQSIVDDLLKKTDDLNAIAGFYVSRYTRQLEYGQLQLAHDVCRFLHQKGLTKLIVEGSFVARVSQEQNNDDPEALRQSQKYRQFAAVSKFISVLKNTAVKYGIAVDERNARNTTRICQYCNYLNSSTEKECFICEGCGRQVNQDQNAAVNLSRIGADLDLSEMALSSSAA